MGRAQVIPPPPGYSYDDIVPVAAAPPPPPGYSPDDVVEAGSAEPRTVSERAAKRLESIRAEQARNTPAPQTVGQRVKRILGESKDAAIEGARDMTSPRIPGIAGYPGASAAYGALQVFGGATRAVTSPIQAQEEDRVIRSRGPEFEELAQAQGQFLADNIANVAGSLIPTGPTRMFARRVARMPGRAADEPLNLAARWKAAKRPASTTDGPKQGEGWTSKPSDDIPEPGTTSVTDAPPAKLDLGDDANPVYAKTIYRGESHATPVDEGMYGKGEYWTTNPEYAGNYAAAPILRPEVGPGKLHTAQASLTNPYVTDGHSSDLVMSEITSRVYQESRAKGITNVRLINEQVSKEIRRELESRGHDGIVLTQGKHDEVVVFRPDVSLRDKRSVPFSVGRKGQVIPQEAAPAKPSNIADLELQATEARAALKARRTPPPEPPPGYVASDIAAIELKKSPSSVDTPVDAGLPFDAGTGERTVRSTVGKPGAGTYDPATYQEPPPRPVEPITEISPEASQRQAALEAAEMEARRAAEPPPPPAPEPLPEQTNLFGREDRGRRLDQRDIDFQEDTSFNVERLEEQLYLERAAKAREEADAIAQMEAKGLDPVTGRRFNARDSLAQMRQAEQRRQKGRGLKTFDNERPDAFGGTLKDRTWDGPSKLYGQEDVTPPAVSRRQGLAEKLEAERAALREQQAGRRGTILGSGVGNLNDFAEDLPHYIKIGAYNVALGADDLAKFSKAMRDEFPELSDEQVASIFDQSRKMVSTAGRAASVGPTGTPEAAPGGQKSFEEVPETPQVLTAARKVDMAKDRELLGLDSLESPERRSWRTVLETANDSDLPDRALRVAQEINTKPRPLTDVETGGLVLRAAKLKNEHGAASKRLADLQDPADIQTAAAEINRIEQEFDSLSHALRSSGTEKGRALAAQKLTIDQDYNLVSVLTRAKAAKGKPLNDIERRKLEMLTMDLEQRTKRVAELEKMVNDRAAEHTTKLGAARYRTMPPAQKAAELTKLVDEARALLRAGCKN